MGKGGRPRKIAGESTAIQLLVPDDVLRAYDAWLSEVQASVPGGEGITRPDIMRDVLARAVRARMAKAARAKRRKGQTGLPSPP